MQARYRTWVRFVVTIVAVFSVLGLLLAQPSPSLAGTDNTLTFRAQPTATPAPEFEGDGIDWNAINARIQSGIPGDEPVCAIRGMDALVPEITERQPAALCSGGTASGFPCLNVDLMAHLPLNQIGGGNGNDIWGWSYTSGGVTREFAIMGRTNGTSFVEITNATNPVYLGNLPSHTGSSSWRDIKVYQNHAYIVSDSNGNHGMQVFNLVQLLNVSNPPVTFSETAHYNRVGSSHNIAINEETGFAYIIGGSSGTTTCSGGLHMVNIQNPTNPTFAGCYSSDGYTHDTQCVIYDGPDTQHQGKEICFSSNEDTLTITDVTNKSNPLMLARVPYNGSAYTHQGWLTEDQTYFLLDDELDETGSNPTSTFIWDVSNLDNPVNTGDFNGTSTARDHNQYIKGDYSYQANYRAGLRILNIANIENAQLSEVAYFDIYPTNNGNQFNGAWSTYPYFASGNVIVSGIEQGLFVVRPNLGGSNPTATPVPPTPTRTPTGVPPTATRTPTNVPATNTPVPPTATPGNGTITYTGTLPGTGSNAYHPTEGYSSGAGIHTGDLNGTGSDFDLYLQRWNGSSWSNVASGTSSDSTEFVSYNGTAGTYRWRVYSYRGSGSYTLVTTRPSGTSPTSTPVPPTPTPGSGSTTYTGTLPGTGSNAYHPSSGYSSGAGTHTGDLTGTGNDFDLYLQRWNGSSWATVASGLSSDSTEFVSYNGTAGTYRWRVYSYSGSGSYTLVTTRPTSLTSGDLAPALPSADAPEDKPVQNKVLP